MKTFILVSLIFHILAGFTALFIGLIPMFSKKGSRLHNRAGRIYVYCMLLVAITALLLCILQPFKMMRLFLTGIAVFSFYLCMTGWCATKQKKTGPALGDRILSYVTLPVGLAMIVFGVFLITRTNDAFFPILFAFFGILTTTFAGQDIKRFKQLNLDKQHWFFQHFTRMGGSYIATFTAALVVNVGRIMPADAPGWVGIIAWIAPGIVGGMLIGRTVTYYKQKFAAKANKTVLV